MECESSSSKESIKKNDVSSLKPTIKTLDLSGLLSELKKLNDEKVDIAEEIKRIKKVLELLNEIDKTLDDSSSKKILVELINSGLLGLRTLSEKVSKDSKPKKSLKKVRRVEAEATVTCKIDDRFVASDSLSANDGNITSKILNNEVYDIIVDENLQLDLKDSETKCNNPTVDDSKKNVVYKSHTNAEVEASKNRVKYNLYASIKDSYKIPEFYYLFMKTNVKYKKNGTNEETEEELDSYCILKDASNKDNAQFECFAFPENIGSVSDVNRISSNYITVPGNTTEENYNNGVNFYRKGKSSGRLSAGAIIGIILGCLAVLIAIILTIICVNKSRAATAAVPYVSTVTDSHNNIQVSSMSGQFPAKV